MQSQLTASGFIWSQVVKLMESLQQGAASNSDTVLPLDGIRVVEICQIAAGPFCGMLLGDLGADVIKIEPPQGDAMRQWPPFNGASSENFASINRNKRAISLNLKLERDLKVAKDLIQFADVVLENNRPGVMKRLGLDYKSVSRINSRVVYCSISAFGQTGPRSIEGAFDVTMQAISGIMSVTGEEGEPPVKCGVPLSDFATGLYAAMHINSALFARARSGKSVHIDASMLGSSLGIAALQTSEFFGTGINPSRIGSRHPRNAPYQAYQAADDYFVLAAGNQNLFEMVCDLINRPDLKQDPRFTSTLNRTTHQNELAEILEKEFSTNTAKYWYERFRKAGVPTSLINQYGDALADPQVQHYGWVQPLDLPRSQFTTKTFSHPIMLNEGELPIRRRPPDLDEHRVEILEELKELVKNDHPRVCQ